jgi:N-acetylglucosamine kinase-like BadF-type ATPase
MKRGLWIGVDGGGTRTTAIAAREDGTVVALARSGGLNYNNIGMDKARENLRGAVAELLAACGAEAYETLCVGLSALDREADAAERAAFAGHVFDPARLDLQSDAYTALMGFTLGAPGMIVICGTGSMLLALDKRGEKIVRGGWGHLLGDPGSAYTLALEGLRAAIDASEGVGDGTGLLDSALRFFRLSTLRDLIPRVYAPDFPPEQLAQFAREVLTEAAAGDAVALGVLRRNMAHVARQAAGMLAIAPEAGRVGVYGGVFTHNPFVRALLGELLAAIVPGASVSLPEYPPELGALIHAYRRRGETLSPQRLQNLKQSYAALSARQETEGRKL